MKSSSADVSPQLDVLGEKEGEYKARKFVKIEAREKAGTSEPSPAPEKVIALKFRKFKNVGEMLSRVDGSGSAMGHGDGRECFSMASYEYVVDDSSSLHVPIKPLAKKMTSQWLPLPLSRVTGRPCRSTTTTRVEASTGLAARTPAMVPVGKRESFFVSKIWLRSWRRERLSTIETSW